VERDHCLDKAENPNSEIDKFVGQLKEMRSEQKELVKELSDLRYKIENNIDLDDKQDIQSLKDDIQFFTAENLELRLKIKSLVTQNIKQKIRIEELNDNGNAFNLSAISE